LTDGDIRVSRNYLREVISPLGSKEFGAVTSFYRGVAEKNLGAELEDIGAASGVLCRCANGHLDGGNDVLGWAPQL